MNADERGDRAWLRRPRPDSRRGRSSPVVAAMPALTFAASGSGRGVLDHARRPAGRRRPSRAGSRRRRARRPAGRAPAATLELGCVAVGDDDGRDAHRRERLPVDRERPLGRRPPREQRARARGPAAASSLALARAARRIPSASPSRRRRRPRRRRPRASASSGTVTTGVPLAIASSTGRPKPS